MLATIDLVNAFFFNISLRLPGPTIAPFGARWVAIKHTYNYQNTMVNRVSHQQIKHQLVRFTLSLKRFKDCIVEVRWGK